MNYRFENIYTRADMVKRQHQVAEYFSANNMGLTSAAIVMVVQFGLWSPMLWFLTTRDIPFAFMAVVLFVSFIAIGLLYDSLILPHVAAHFDKKASSDPDKTFSETIYINDDEICIRESEQEIIFKWTAIQFVEDKESVVFLLTEKGYCSIPAKCFAGFLEKDAFVRACREKIHGRTPQGAYFA